MAAERTIISTHSFRGGTGKSNLTANLAVLVARAGHRVGIIDTDIQSPGIHVLFNLPEMAQRKSLNDYLWGKCRIQDAACDVTASAIGDFDPASSRPRLYLIPSSMDSNEIARILTEGYDVTRLNDGIHELMDADHLDLDYLFIDTHPGVNEETLLSIAVSHKLLLVMRPDNQDFQGTSVTVELARQLDVPAMHLVINKVPPGTDTIALRQRVQDLYQTAVAGVLPLNAEIVRVASGGIFVNRFPDHPFAVELRQIASRIFGTKQLQSAG
ncbi:MAG: MinD/ParA family protein [Pirellulales bacterium]